jgi:hypothetical protein
MPSWLSDRSLTRDMIISTCCSHAAVTFRQKSHTTHDNINMLVTCCHDFDSMWPTCWYYHVSCTTSVGKSRQHVTNMLMLSCLVCEFCRKVMTACDQHVNVIMCRVRLLSESDASMWTTCWYYHVSCKTSVGKSRDNNNMLVTCCHDFPTEFAYETW